MIKFTVTKNNLRRSGVIALSATVFGAATMFWGNAACSHEVGVMPVQVSGGDADTGGATAPFPLVLPWDDGKPSFTDVSFLNDAPAGKNGHIVARGEQFVYGKTGKPVQLTGIVFTFASPFPGKSDAEKVAARLAKYGINAVRLHYFDHEGYGRVHIWDATKSDYRHLDPAQLDRLDYFVAQLKKRGIYVNINLKVARTFTPQDGLPESVRKIPFWATKRVDFFYPPMIALQKEYAKKLLLHKNPYTGTTYAAEPSVWAVEINNENSVTEQDDGAGLLTLPEPFRTELTRQWNGWLATKYGTTAKLKSAWFGKGGADAGMPRASVLKADSTVASAWKLEQHPPQSLAEASDEGGGVFKIDVTRSDRVGWRVQWMQTERTLENGKEYTLRFRAKSDVAGRPMAVNVSRDVEDWRNVGLGRSVPVGTKWETFEYVFTPNNALPQHSRLAFEIGEQEGKVWLADITLQKGAVVKPLTATETLESRSVPLPLAPVTAQLSDWRTFLAETEIGYANEMRRFLRKDLGVQSMVINSQIGWGRLTGAYREQGSDYVDTHGYWDHPALPGGVWDSVGNLFQNKPMVPELGKNDILTGLAKQRIAGKPYFASEYNHPAPNEYAVETVPLVSVMSAFQGWQGFLLHEYGDYGTVDGNTADAAQIQGYFANGSDPSKMAFFPSGAILARCALIPPATDAITALLPAVSGSQDILSAWSALPGGDLATNNALLTKRLRVGIGGVPPSGGTVSGDPWVQKVLPLPDGRGVYVGSNRYAVVTAGHVGGQTATFTTGTITFDANVMPNDYAALTVVPLDKKPLASSDRILLTALARVQNTGQKWKPGGKSLETWGTAPTLADAISATVSLKTDGNRIVRTLDETGTPKATIPATYRQGVLTFRLSPRDRAVWYAITK